MFIMEHTFYGRFIEHSQKVHHLIFVTNSVNNIWMGILWREMLIKLLFPLGHCPNIIKSFPCEIQFVKFANILAAPFFKISISWNVSSNCKHCFESTKDFSDFNLLPFVIVTRRIFRSEKQYVLTLQLRLSK